jgi:hypothetical protein
MTSIEAFFAYKNFLLIFFTENAMRVNNQHDLQKPKQLKLASEDKDFVFISPLVWIAFNFPYLMNGNFEIWNEVGSYE